MIKIFDKLWYVTREDKGDLSYMCQYEETASGAVAANVKNMQKTGRRWSKNGGEHIIDNVPTKDIYVGNSVSRWSTSNKVFRVQDPRGFTVEIPTDNLATLLHHTTVVKGVIQDECVWAKDGVSHVLLPVNSEPYKKSREVQNTVENELISVNDLKVGDWVKLLGLNNEYYFLGRVKITWKLCSSIPNYNRGYQQNTEFTDWYEISDNKYVNIFIYPRHNDEAHFYAETPTKPKIVEVVRNEVMEVDLSNISWISPPDRVTNQLWELVNTGHYGWINSEIVSIKYRDGTVVVAQPD